MERRLAAIVAADVVGYSRLIRADEEGTITALKALRADLIDPRIGRRSRLVTFQPAEVAKPRTLFTKILCLIDQQRPAP